LPEGASGWQLQYKYPTTLEAIVQSHKVVSHEGWLAARRQLLAEEKEFTQLRDRLSRSAWGLPLGVSPRTVSSKRP
jgi:predicted dithiol-disulfide oxidoreductase (DUF899 family)